MVERASLTSSDGSHGAARPEDRSVRTRGRRRAVVASAEFLLDALAITAFVVMLLSSLAQVLFRYALEIPVPWTEELARFLFVIAMLLGMAIAVREKEHIVVDFLFRKLPPAVQAAVAIAFDALILGFLVALLRGAIGLIGLNWSSRLIALNWISVGWLYAVEAFAVVLIILYVLADLVRQGRALRHDRTKESATP